MRRNTSVALGNYFEEFMENKILVGLESGITKDFQPKKQLASLKANKRKTCSPYPLLP